MNRRALAILSILVLSLPLAGCGDDDTPQPPARSPHLLRLQPENDVKVATAASPAPAVASDPLDSDGDHFTQSSDPLDSGGDSLEGKNALGGQDPLSAHGTSNWYWLRGNITGGAIAITVDGVSFGTYTVHMDKEITQMLHPGINSITFAAQRDNPSVPVQAHLEVVYSQMEQGQLPPLIYDTRNTLKSSTPVLKAPPPVYKPVESSDGNSDNSGNAGSAGSSDSIPSIPPAPKGLAAPTQESPTTLTFEAQ